MNKVKKQIPGILISLIIALPSWLAGKLFPIVGGPVIAIVCGMLLACLIQSKALYTSGIHFASKNVLQYAVILLGFGLNLSVVFQTGKQSLPIIICTILTSLLAAFLLHKAMHIPANISILIGVGSAICGGSAIAATAPVIDAQEDEVAQAISVIFFFNIVAAILFPSLGTWLGFSKTSGEAFGIFAGTAINDTSSVSAASSTWDSMYHLASATLDKAITVKLTRTLAIIPITLILAFQRTKMHKRTGETQIKLRHSFPFFIVYFILASVVTTLLMHMGVSSSIFEPLKELSKFLIILAMAAIGLNSDIIKLMKRGGKPLLMGFGCWLSITIVSLGMQQILGIW